MERRTAIRILGASAMTISPFARSAHAIANACTAESTGEEVTRGIDLSGRTAVVTGCNSGIGFETMRVLALRGAQVIGTARTIEKGREACARVQGRATPVVLELTDFDSVVQCSKRIREIAPRIDMLILNAGIVLDRHETVYGLEKQFVVNHLGHFLLTHRVLEIVKGAPQGRVVTVGSGDHRKAPENGIQFDDLSGKGWSDKGYAHSKLANGLFSLALSDRLAGTRATSNVLRPGHVRTNILKNVGGGYLKNAKTPHQGAATVCYVATHPSLGNVSGKYFADCSITDVQSAHHIDRAMAQRLWEVSTRLVEKYLA